MKAILSVTLLVIANFFMTFAWYGHLEFRKWKVLQDAGLLGIILISWGIAFFEYIFQVPGNRIGSNKYGGPFDLFQLKMIQEVVTLSVFSVCAVFIFKTDKFTWNYVVGFIFLLLAVFFVFKKW